MYIYKPLVLDLYSPEPRLFSTVRKEGMKIIIILQYICHQTRIQSINLTYDAPILYTGIPENYDAAATLKSTPYSDEAEASYPSVQHINNSSDPFLRKERCLLYGFCHFCLLQQGVAFYDTNHRTPKCS